MNFICFIIKRWRGDRVEWGIWYCMKTQGSSYRYGHLGILKFVSNLSWFAGPVGVSALSHPFIAPTDPLSHCLWQKRSPPNSLLLSLPQLNLPRLQRVQGEIKMLIWCRLKSTIHFTLSIPHVSLASHHTPPLSQRQIVSLLLQLLHRKEDETHS